MKFSCYEGQIVRMVKMVRIVRINYKSYNMEAESENRAPDMES